jgi:hypothetical protein
MQGDQIPQLEEMDDFRQVTTFKNEAHTLVVYEKDP